MYVCACAKWIEIISKLVVSFFRSILYNGTMLRKPKLKLKYRIIFSYDQSTNQSIRKYPPKSRSQDVNQWENQETGSQWRHFFRGSRSSSEKSSVPNDSPWLKFAWIQKHPFKIKWPSSPITMNINHHWNSEFIFTRWESFLRVSYAKQVSQIN